jgi:hypothetical protein
MTKTTLNQHQSQIIPIRTIIRFFKVQLQNNRAHMVREHDSSSPISIPKTKERFVLLGFHTFVLIFKGFRFPTTPLTGSSNDTQSCFVAPSKGTDETLANFPRPLTFIASLASPSPFVKSPESHRASLWNGAQIETDFEKLDGATQGVGRVVEYKVDGTDDGTLIRELLPWLLHNASTVEMKLGWYQGSPTSSPERVGLNIH